MLATEPTPVLYTARDCSKITGIPYQQVLIAIRAGTLPAIKIQPRGQSYYVHADDLDRFVRGETQQPLIPPRRRRSEPRP